MEFDDDSPDEDDTEAESLELIVQDRSNALEQTKDAASALTLAYGTAAIQLLKETGYDAHKMRRYFERVSAVGLTFEEGAALARTGRDFGVALATVSRFCVDGYTASQIEGFLQIRREYQSPAKPRFATDGNGEAVVLPPVFPNHIGYKTGFKTF